jgi:hypothetical protein
MPHHFQADGFCFQQKDSKADLQMGKPTHQQLSQRNDSPLCLTTIQALEDSAATWWLMAYRCELISLTCHCLAFLLC